METQSPNKYMRQHQLPTLGGRIGAFQKDVIRSVIRSPDVASKSAAATNVLAIAGTQLKSVLALLG